MEGYLELSNYTCHYKTIGSPKSQDSFWIFLHEGLGSIPQWKGFPEQLCRHSGRPGLLFERNGYGRSTAPGKKRPKDFLHREAFDALPEILQKLNLNGPQHIFGHSDGATIGLLYASRQPEKLKTVIAVAPHVFLEDVSVKGIARTRKAFLDGKLKGGLEKYHAPHTDNVVLSWTDYWLNPINSDWNMFDDLLKITAPVLFIQGNRDMYGTLQQGEEIKRRVQGGYDSLTLENGGHNPHFEYPYEVMTKSMSFSGVK